MAQFLCIGIPARNEAKSLERTIDSILKSRIWLETPSAERELIVCVNASKDRTADIVRKVQKRIPELVLIESSTPGKNRAINTIVKRSNRRADVIYFSDADVLVRKDTIGKVVHALRSDTKVEFAAPIAVPSADFVAKKLRGPTAALYAEGSRLGREYNLYRLTGSGFAVKKPFIAERPLPEHPAIGDDRFINLAYPKKIRVVYDARVIFRQPTWADHLRQRVRHKVDKRTLLDLRPDLIEHEAIERQVITPRKLDYLRKLSFKAKVGFVFNQLAEGIATWKARKRKPESWPTIKSTKLSKRKR